MPHLEGKTAHYLHPQETQIQFLLLLLPEVVVVVAMVALVVESFLYMCLNGLGCLCFSETICLLVCDVDLLDLPHVRTSVRM